VQALSLIDVPFCRAATKIRVEVFLTSTFLSVWAERPVSCEGVGRADITNWLVKQ